MIRCSQCHSPNSESNAYCGKCGAALVIVKPSLLRVSDWLDGQVALTALKGAFLLSALQVAAAGHFLVWSAQRAELELLWFFVAYGAALAMLGTKWRGKRVLGWAALGVAGGLLAYGLDFLYNYQHWIYKAVWWAVTLLSPSNDNRAAETAYGLLQMLRFFGLALPLIMVQTWNRRGIPLLKAVIFFLLAESLIFHVRAAFLRFSLTGDFAVQFLLYFSALFLFYYGLDRLDGNGPK